MAGYGRGIVSFVTAVAEAWFAEAWCPCPAPPPVSMPRERNDCRKRGFRETMGAAYDGHGVMIRFDDMYWRLVRARGHCRGGRRRKQSSESYATRRGPKRPPSLSVRHGSRYPDIPRRHRTPPPPCLEARPFSWLRSHPTVGVQQLFLSS